MCAGLSFYRSAVKEEGVDWQRSERNKSKYSFIKLMMSNKILKTDKIYSLLIKHMSHLVAKE